MNPKKPDAVLDMMAHAPLFKKLTPAELGVARAAARIREAGAQSFYFHQSHKAERQYMLLTGRVKIIQLTDEGQEVVMRFIVPGEIFGLIAALGTDRYPASAESLETSTALEWNASAMAMLVDTIPRIARNTVAILAERIRELENRYRELATERVERRIARTLTRLVTQAGQRLGDVIEIKMPLTRQTLAETAGTTLFTVSRILSRWEKEGILSCRRGKIAILSPRDLIRMAEDLPD